MRDDCSNRLPVPHGASRWRQVSPFLIGLILAAAWAVPSRAEDCAATKDLETARVSRAYDAKLSELASYAAAHPDNGEANVTSVERRLKLLKRVALKRIRKATKACAKDRRAERISRVADFYLSKKLKAAIPARLALGDRESANPEPAPPPPRTEGPPGSAPPAERTTRTEAPAVPMPDRSRDAAPGDAGATASKPVSPTEPVPRPAAGDFREQLPPAAPPPVASKPAPKAIAEALPVDAALKTRVDADIAFDQPEKVRLDNALPFHVKLPAPSPASARQAPAQDDQKAQDRIAATLSGGDALNIVPSGPQIQWVRHDDSAEWRWEITPKATGQQLVTLSLDSVTTIDGKDTLQHLRTLTHKIDVDAAAPASSPSGLMGFLKAQLDGMSWLWAAFFVLLGLVFLLRRRRKPEERAK